MKNYSQFIYKHLRVNKKRSIYTIFGIMLGIVLFTTVGNLQIFINKVNIENSKIHNGNYEAYIYNMNKDKIKEIENNVKIKDYGFVALESTELININDIAKNILIYALDTNCIDNIFNKSMKLEEGRFPKNKGEVTLDIVTKIQLNKNIGDTIDVGDKKYKVVGFYSSYEFNPYELKGITYFEKNKTYNNLISLINIKGETNIRKNILQIANDMKIETMDKDIVISFNSNESENNKKTLFELNRNLIECYEIKDIFNLKNMNEIKLFFLFVNLGILILTIILTLSSINVSMKERIKYFATLRCLGATPEKITYLLIKEILVLSSLSIVPGLILGYGLTYFTINIVLNKLGKINFYGVQFSIYWRVLISALILVGIVILISSIIPVIKVAKISPIELGKTAMVIPKKVKKRNSKVIKKLFGYKGVLAYKNIRANNKSFMFITLMLSTLLVVLVVFTAFYTSMIKNVSGVERGKIKDFTIEINSITNEEIDSTAIKSIDKQFYRIKDAINFLKNTNSVKNIASYVDISLDTFFTEKEFKDTVKNNNETFNKEGIYAHQPNSNMFIYDDESIKEILPYIKSITDKKITLEDFEDNGVVLVSKNNKISIQDISHGNKLKMYLNTSELNKMKDKKKPIDINVLGIIGENDILGRRNYGDLNKLTFIVSKDFYEKNKWLIFGDEKYISKNSIVDFNFLNKEKREKNLQNIKNYVNKISGFYIDNYDNAIK
ncbi:ABC transporter permease, partial [Clostridium tarantellae]